MRLSVIIPVYNGAGTIVNVVESVKRELAGHELEIILVNDGSTDNSEQVCDNIARLNPEVKFISLKKNFGEHNAVMCGLHHTTGIFTAIIDDDLQNPPSEILKLLEEALKGYDVVYAKYERKQHSWYRNILSILNGYIATSLINKPKSLYLSSFKLMHTDTVKEIIKYRGPFPYIDGLIFRVTENVSAVSVAHNKREKGISNYTFKKLFSLYLNMFFNFSVKPLRIFTVVGFFLFVIGAILSVTFIVEKLVYPETQVGWASIAVIVLTFSGFQLIFLGLIGEYLGKLFLQQNGTPQWVIKNKVNC